MKAITVLSGGMDSSTLAYWLKKEGYEQKTISFFYGQRHKRELASAKEISDLLGAENVVIDISSIGVHLTGSSLTDKSVDVPEGHYAENNMSKTVVPNRNAIMLAISFGIASSWGANVVATAVHAGDRHQYPDCRPEFIHAFQRMEYMSLEGFVSPTLISPFLYKSKAEIAMTGAVLGVPFSATWSCYKGGDLHCGKCGTCVERAESFSLAGLQDPTAYQDPEYWKQAVDEYKLG